MKILLYGLNYAPELTGIGKYSGEMCEWLAEQGHDVRVICAPPYYPEWQVADAYKGSFYQTELRNNVMVFRCPLFVPKNPRTSSRLVHLLSFATSSLPVLFKQWFWKPDVVICIEPTFFCVPATLTFCNLRNSQSLLHIQDFELDAMLGLGLGSTSVIARFAARVECWYMHRFDLISTISYSMLRNVEKKSRHPDKLFYFPNWVDTDFLTPDADPVLFRQRWSIAETTSVVLYSGNMGKKQGLEIVLQAADQLRQESNILFLMIGTGAAKDELMQLADQLQLDNLRFYPLQSYEELPALMALADIHLVVQKKGAADAVLPSKLTSILAVGGESIITAEATTELGLLCKEYPGIARCIEPENAAVLVTTIQDMLLSLPLKTSGVYNKIAHQFALDNLKKDQILGRLVSKLQDGYSE
jgi:colanic acid biosynthesis glycosyl transferase WcaI